MALFKRLTQLLTPPVFRRTPPDDQFEAYAEGPSLHSLLKPHLRRLVSAIGVDDPGTRESVAEIKRIARAKGLYVAAFEMKTQLVTTPILDDQGARNHKARGYILAADFILGHIQRELAAAKAGTQRIGPNIFGGYCNEMIDCLLEGENVRRAIEIPVTVLDDLLVTALDEIEEGGGIYMVLAEQVLASTFQLAQQRSLQQIEKASETPRPRARAEIVATAPSGPLSTIDEEAVSYVAGLQQRVEKIVAGFTAFAGRTPGIEDALQTIDARVEPLYKALAVADSAGYLAFAAAVREHLASLLEVARPEKARELYHGAAERYETQGEQESRLHFTKLSAIRYQKAHSCFVKSGDTQSAARLRPTRTDDLPE